MCINQDAVSFELAIFRIRKNSVFGHFSRSLFFMNLVIRATKNVILDGSPEILGM